HWLMKEPDLEEERLYAEGRGMVLEIRRQSMSEDPGLASIVSPSGRRSEIRLTEVESGIFTAALDVEEIGLYEIENGDLSALAHVGPVNAPEFADARSSTERLAGIAEASRGSVRRVGSRPDQIS